MYLGVHYPGDIIGGLLLATCFAIPLYLILRKTKAIKKDETPVSPAFLEYSILIFLPLLLILAFVLPIN